MEKRFSNNLSFLGAYTFGKSIDEQSQASLGFDNSTGVRSEYNYRWEKSRSDFDQTHRFVVSYTYDLPFGRKLTGAAKILVGGWQFVGIHSFTTGTPFTVHARTDFSNSGGERPAQCGSGRIPTPPGGRSRQEWFNPAAFTNPASGQFGNVGRYAVTGSSNISIDFSLFKNFTFTTSALRFSSGPRLLQPDQSHPNFTACRATYDGSNPGQLTAAGLPGKFSSR